MEAPLLHLALVGTPNSGKTSLFNALTGSRQKVANYPGVTVERKEGGFVTPSGRQVSLVDLPGTYSLRGRSPDEEITRDMVLGRTPGEAVPDLVLCVADSTNLRLTIRLLLELKNTGRPLMLVLNMFDIATRRGVTVDVPRLSEALGVPVVTSIAVRKGGTAELLRRTDEIAAQAQPRSTENLWEPLTVAQLRATQREADRIIASTVSLPSRPDSWTARIDAVVLHPVAGLAILALILFVMFQAVFAWAQPLMELLSAAFSALGQLVHNTLPAGLLQSFLENGVISGVGSVIVFLPQIIIIFLFILLLGRFRLHGARGVPDGPHHGRRRAARPRLHSAAVEFRLRHPRHHGDTGDRQPPRPADHHPDRAADDLLGADPGLHADHLRLHPGHTGLGLGQSARARDVRPLRGRHLQRARRLLPHQSSSCGATTRRRRSCWSCRTTRCRGRRASRSEFYTRALMFLQRAGTTIFSMMVLIWFLASFPTAPAGATDPAINYSLAAMIGKALEPLLAPLGFNWQIAVALIPGMAAREVAVAALGTVYAIEGGKEAADQIGQVLATKWSLATALSLLAWYIFAPQCASTLAVIRRETGSWKWMAITFAYMFALAYAASFATYSIAVSLGAG